MQGSGTQLKDIPNGMFRFLFLVYFKLFDCC